jgi:NAD(P)-dependent dehydrogenase (short-subunit alcohol dehydrogenase family)
MKRLEGKRILVTGAGSGIGQATALRLLDEGATVVGADIAADGLGKTRVRADEAATGDRMTTLEMNVGDEDSVIDGVCWAVEKLGGLDSLVNAAGILRAAHTHRTSAELWNQIIAVNLTGTFLVVRDRELQLHVGLVRPSLHGRLRGEQRRSSGLHPFFGTRIREGRSACGMRGAGQHQVRDHRRDRGIHSQRR